MKVNLLSYTTDALNLLLRTKNTRLKFDSDPSVWPKEVQEEHLAYMRDTIRSSWEFVDFVFEIVDVTRAFTHQLVRTRAGSYAQESQRTIDASKNGYLNPIESVTEFGPKEWFDKACDEAFMTYGELLRTGTPAQDARGVLPTATLTTIVAKFNLRTLSEMAKVRLCVRTQGEYQDVFRAMRERVLEACPWAEDFIEVACVADGTCAFPRYGKEQCPIYDPRMDLSELKKETAIKFWSAPRHVAVPIAKSGKTM